MVPLFVPVLSDGGSVTCAPSTMLSLPLQKQRSNKRPLVMSGQGRAGGYIQETKRTVQLPGLDSVNMLV